MQSTRVLLQRTLAVALVAILAVGVLPTAEATVSTTYGTIVDEKTGTSDPGQVMFHATTISAANIQRETANAVGSRNWYADLDASDTVSIGDVRLNTHEGATTFQAGTRVSSGDADRNSVLDGTAGILCYVQTFLTAGSKHFRGADRFNPAATGASSFLPEAESLYVQPGGGACATQTIGADHIRLTKTSSTNPALGGLSPGTRVKAGEADIGDNTTAGGTMDNLDNDHDLQLRFVDRDLSGGISVADPVYLQVFPTGGPAPGQPAPGDVRLYAGSSFSMGSEAYGSIVEATSFDALKSLTAMAPLIQFVNFDAAGALPACASGTLSDSIYLNVDGAGAVVANGDIRLGVRSSGTGSIGDTVRTGNTDEGDALTAIAAGTFLKFADFNNDAAFNWGDQLILDVGGGAADGIVSIGDIRLSSVVSGAGSAATCVASGNSDINQPLVLTAISVGYLNVWNSAEYQPGNPVYFGPAGDVNIGHVRWSNLYSTLGSFGTQVDDDDPDRTWAITDFAAPRICFLPTNTATYTNQDPVYIAHSNAGCAANLAVGDVRLSGTGTLAAGTQILVSGHDFSDPVSALAAAKLMYVESGDDASGYDDKDRVYVSTDGTTTVKVGNVRVTGGTGGGAGTKVESAGTDISQTLRDFPSAAFDPAQGAVRLGFLNVVPPSGTSFSATYQADDIAVYDQNNDGFLDIGDIFLSGTGGASALPGTGGTTGGGSTGGGQTTPQPTSSFSLTLDGMMVTVNGASSLAPSGRTITGYAWTFGDGDTGSGVQTTHTYAADGNYRVTLTVTDSAGQSHTSARDVTVGNPAPTEPTGGTPTDPTGGTPTDPTGGTPTDPTGPTDDGDEKEGEPEGTPAAPIALVLVALAGLVLAVRRRRQ